MDKRLIGAILITVGVAGLLFAAYNFAFGNKTTLQISPAVVICSILGFLFFFGGIGLIRNTRDQTKKIK